MPGEKLGITVDEKLVLEKFEGDPKDGKLIERLTVRNGKIVKRETFGKEVT